MQDHSHRTQAEAEYWNQQSDRIDCVPDIRNLNTDNDIFYIWNDPVIEDILRGEFRRFIINKALARMNGTALEIGCGTGWLSLELARAGINTKAVDISKKRIAIARKYFISRKKEEDIQGDIDHMVCPIQEAHFNRSSFDLIVCWDSLHHIENLELVMAKIKKWLKPDGGLIIFEHIDLSLLNKLIIMIIYALPLVDKTILFKKIIAKIHSRETMHKAPLEGINKIDMLRVIKQYLEVKVFRTTLALNYYIAPYLRGNKTSRHKRVRFFKKLDDALIAMNFLRGQYMFVYAVKHAE